MEKYRIYERIDGLYRLVIANATKELADNYKSDNRVLIIKQTADRDEIYKLIMEKSIRKDEEMER